MNCWVNDGMNMKDVALALVNKEGRFLSCLSINLRADKEVVLAAVTQNSTIIKFALGGLNQDIDCLKAAGLFDGEETHIYDRPEKSTLSLKFSLGEKSTPYATDFAKAMKRDPFLRQFRTFNPNLGSKPNCDEKSAWTTHAGVHLRPANSQTE